MFLNLATRQQNLIYGSLAPQPVNTTPERKILLDVDVEENDYLYRVQKGSRIVYVSVLHRVIVPQEDRTDVFRIFKHLRRLPKWNENWTTLIVRKAPEGVIQSTTDEFPPHSVDIRTVLDVKYFNFVDLKRLSWYKRRLTLVSLNDNPCI